MVRKGQVLVELDKEELQARVREARAALMAAQAAQEAALAAHERKETDKAYQLALNKQMTALRNVAVSRAEVARAKAQVAQAQAMLDRAEEDLRNSTIVSPMDGIVISRDVEIGDAVSSILVLGSGHDVPRPSAGHPPYALGAQAA